MRISKKTDYALRALFTLVEYYGQEPISIGALAQRNAIPKRFLEHIMLDLKEKGWVRSVPGRQGGYALARHPSRVTVGEVIRHFDGILAPIACVSVTGYEPCSQMRFCRFRRVFLEIRNFTAKLLDRTDLASVCTGQPVSHSEVFDPGLMADGAGI
jgi:Rrf2 family protein